jgi:hypothetical protein
MLSVCSRKQFQNVYYLKFSPCYGAKHGQMGYIFIGTLGDFELKLGNLEQIYRFLMYMP